MPRFAFRAINASSQAVSGVLVAETVRSVENTLMERGLWMVEAEVEPVAQVRSRAKTIKRQDLADVFGSLSALLAAGVDVSESLAVLTAESPNPALAPVLADVRLNVQSGVSLDEAMAQHPEVFDAQIVNLIQAGSYGGRLVEACTDIATHLEWTEQLVADVKQATTYPMMLVIAVLGLTVLMFTFVVPQFADIFTALDLELPGLTVGVIAVGSFLTSFWWLLLVGVAALVGLLKFGPRYSQAFALSVDRAKLNLPLFGEIISMLAQSRFAHNMMLLLSAGVSIVEALRLVGNVVDNTAFARAVAETEIAVTEGRRMSEALNKDGLFSPIVMRMLVVGEETGQLDECLHMVSKRFDAEIPRRIKRLFGVLEPIITLTLIGVVGLVAASIFLPLFSLMSGVMS